MRKIFTLFLVVLVLCAVESTAQINYTQNFEVNNGSFTGTFGRFTGTTACGGAGGAMRQNLYSSVTTGNLTSPSLGTSGGFPTTITYDYKVANWSANTTGTTNPWGKFDVQWSNSAAGPWTTVQTVDQTNHVVSGTCANKSATFTPTAGPLFVRFNATWSAGDYYLNFDNITVTETAPACSGTPVGGTAVTSNASVCAGSTATLSLAGASVASGLTYQWQSSPAGANTYSNVTGATTSTYVATVTASTDYLCIVTCTASGQTGASSVVTVNTVNCSYDVSRSTGAAFVPINATGTSFTGFTSSDDSYSSATNIGFTFSYRGQNFTQLLVNTNGFIQLGATSNGATYTNGFGGTFYPNLIAPLWDDWVTQGNAGSASVGNFIKYQLSGTAPNRVLTVEWFGMERFQYPGPNINFQVKLYENSNIEFIYGNMLMFDGTTTNSLASANSYSLGITGAASNVGVDKILSLQRENSNCFNTTDPSPLLGNSIECFTKYTFVPGTYTACTPPALGIPANDEIGGALPLSVNPSPCTDLCGTYYTSVNATASATPASSCSTAPDDDVWFKFVATSAAQTITVRSATGYDAVIGLYDNTNTEVSGFGCVNATGVYGLTEVINATGLTVGNTYYIRVSHNGAGSGNNNGFSICVNEVVVPPSNDDPCGAFALTEGNATCTPYEDNPASLPSKTAFIAATNTTASGVVAPSCTGAGTTVQDVWFSFVPTTTSDVVTVTPKSGTNAAFQVYSATGSCPSALTLTPIICVNNASTGGVETTLLTALTPGATYFVRVYPHPSGQGGAPVSNSQFSICVNTPPAPLCTTNSSPANAATNVGLTPTLSWAAAPNAASYDVYLGTSVATATLQGNVTTTTYAVTPALAPNTQYYWYVVPKNGTGSATGCDANNATSFTTAPPPPPNDNICNAIALTIDGAADCQNTATATTETAETTTPLSCSTPNNTVWYKFTPTTTGPVQIVMQLPSASNSLFGYWIQLYTVSGCPTPALTLSGTCFSLTTGAANAKDSFSVNVTAGTEYYIMVDGVSGDYGAFCLNLKTPSIAPGTNNSCTSGINVTINTTNGNNNSWLPLFDNDGNLIAALNANGNDLGATTVSFYKNAGVVRQTALGTYYLDRNITITPTTQPTTPVDVRVYFTETERAALEAAQGITVLASDLKATKNSQTCGGVFSPNLAGEVELTQTSSVAYGNGWVNTYSVNSFSSFFLHIGTGTLPVTVSNIRGEITGTTNTVYWTTASENNNQKFVVERSTDGSNFAPLGEVASRAMNGTSNTALYYNFVDANPVQGKAFYRLKMLDNTGRISFSQIITLRRGAGKLEIVDVRPNPTTGLVYFNVLGTSSNINVAVRDLSGKEVIRKGLVQSNSFNVDMSKLANGMYILEAVDVKSNEKAVFKVIKN